MAVQRCPEVDDGTDQRYGQDRIVPVGKVSQLLIVNHIGEDG